jgi:hypothetical protein
VLPRGHEPISDIVPHTLHIFSKRFIERAGFLTQKARICKRQDSGWFILGSSFFYPGFPHLRGVSFYEKTVNRELIQNGRSYPAWGAQLFGLRKLAGYYLVSVAGKSMFVIFPHRRNVINSHPNCAIGPDRPSVG